MAIVSSAAGRPRGPSFSFIVARRVCRSAMHPSSLRCASSRASAKTFSSWMLRDPILLRDLKWGNLMSLPRPPGEWLGLTAYVEPTWPVRPFPKRCTWRWGRLEQFDGLSTVAERVQAMKEPKGQLYGFTLFRNFVLQNAQESQCGQHGRVLFATKG